MGRVQAMRVVKGDVWAKHFLEGCCMSINICVVSTIRIRISRVPIRRKPTPTPACIFAGRHDVRREQSYPHRVCSGARFHQQR